MASRFVSGGTNEEPTERDEAWLAAQKEIDAKRLAEKTAASQQDGKSLYETLQANKAAKQDAFEESIRLRNQFRSLDEDEVEFLDSVLESTRAREAEVRRETSQQLHAFRELQREAEKSGGQDAEIAVEVAETWTTGPRKRKKGRESVLGGVKLRRVSTTEKPAVSPAALEGDDGEKRGGLPATDSNKEGKVLADNVIAASPTKQDAATSATPPKEAVRTQSPSVSEKQGEPQKPSPPPTVALGLGAYSSDEDEGD